MFSRSRSSSFLVFIRSDQFFVDVGACARGDEKEQKKIDQEKGFWWTDEPPLSSRSHSSSLFDHDNDPSSSLFPGPLTTYGLLFDFLFKNSPAVDYFVSLREGGRDGGGKEGEVWLGGPIRSGHVNQNFLKKVEQLCSSPLSSFISSSSPPSSSSPSIFSYITDFLRLTLFPSWAVSSTSLFEEKCSENLHLFITTDGERKSIRVQIPFLFLFLFLFLLLPLLISLGSPLFSFLLNRKKKKLFRTFLSLGFHLLNPSQRRKNNIS